MSLSRELLKDEIVTDFKKNHCPVILNFLRACATCLLKFDEQQKQLA